MTTRVAGLSVHDAAIPAARPLAVRRTALWTLLAGLLLAGWGVRWDIQWHVQIGRDSFWIAPHLLTYAGIGLTVLVSFGVLAWETWRRDPELRGLTILGLRGTRGFHVAAWGIAITVLAAPIDDLWHRLFGLDVTVWSPPHLLGFLGAAVNTLGCLLIAREVYPRGSRAGLAALVVAGAWLYGTINPTLTPASLVAYRHGGIAFHTYAMLAALLLPLGLVATARLSGWRWAPVLVLAVVLASNIAGDWVTRAGFAWLRPVPVAEAEIARDPTSPIALAREIAAKNRSVPGAPRRDMRPLALLAPLVMSLVDVRRRPVWGTVGYAIVVFAVSGWGMATSPAFQPMVPSLPESAVALALTVAAAALSGLVGRRLSDHLAT
jgi:hypothetical protein